MYFPIPGHAKGNKHGSREKDELQNWLDMTSHENRGFARRDTQVYACDFAASLGFLFVRRGMEKNKQKKTLELWIHFMEGFEISTDCVC